MVLYFSGTGNSQYVAARIASSTHDSILSINEQIKHHYDTSISSSLPFVFVLPTHGWRIPRIVEHWIENTSLIGNTYAYFVLTCGDGTGNAKRYCRLLCQKKGWTFMGLASIVMPENYIAMFPVPDQEQAERIIQAAEPHITSVINTIKKQEPLPKSPVSFIGWLESGIVNPLFCTFLIRSKGFYTTDACVGCGQCVTLCPTNNITLFKGKPHWGKACTHCMACICRCPHEAIEYKRRSKGKPRYFLHPNENVIIDDES